MVAVVSGRLLLCSQVRSLWVSSVMAAVVSGRWFSEMTMNSTMFFVALMKRTWCERVFFQWLLWVVCHYVGAMDYEVRLPKGGMKGYSYLLGGKALYFVFGFYTARQHVETN